MGVFKRFWSWLASFFYTEVSSSEVFPSVDIDQAARELELDYLAKIAGNKNLPPKDSSELDQVELKIVDYITHRVNDSTSKFQTHISTLNQQLQAHISIIKTDITAATHDLTTSLRAEMTKHFDYYQQTKDDYHNRKLDLKRFKENNKIERDASYPGNKINHLGIVFIIFTLEVILNGGFFAKGSELGLIGGTTEAFLIGIVNILVSYNALGKAIRLSFYKDVFRKIIGIAIVTLLSVFLLGFNLLVADYRSLFVLEGREYAVQNVLMQFYKTPWHIGDFQSLLLLIMGIICCALAAWKGATTDDVIPRYGELDRKAKETARLYHYTKREFINLITNEKRQKFTEVRQKKQQLVTAHNSYTDMLGRKSLYINLFTNHLSRLEEACNKLLERYREKNSSNRSTPSPERFSVPFVLSPPINMEQLSTDEFSTEKIEADYQQAVSEVEKHIQNIYDTYDQCINRFREEQDEELPTPNGVAEANA